MVRTLVKLAVAASALTLSSSAWALDNYVAYIPNGTVNSCGNCHVNAAGSGPRNAFGMAVETTRVNFLPSWMAVYNLDSDGDGFTNGEELGDPCGVWVRPQMPPITMGITKPGDPASVPTMHTIDTCNASSSSAGPSSDAPASSAGGSSSSGASSSSSAASSSSSGGTTTGGGCCGGGETAARMGDLSMLAMFGLVLRARRRR